MLFVMLMEYLSGLVPPLSDGLQLRVAENGLTSDEFICLGAVRGAV